MKMKTLGIFFISIMAVILLLIVSLNSVSTVSAQNATEEELAKLTEGQELTDEPTLPEGEQVTDKCAENGNIAPCIGEEGELVYYCDDPRSAAGTCMPSPQEWQNFLPDCDAVIYLEACSGPEGPVFGCDDPEFDIRKYPYGCIEPGQGQEGKEAQSQEGKEAKSQEGKEAQSQDSKTKSYQLIVYLDDASPQNVIGDNFKILVYNSENESILSAKPNIDFNDDHQKISPRNGYPIIQKTGQNPDDIRVCAQQDYVLNGKSYLHDDCYPIKQNIQKTYWYTIFDYGQIDGFEGGD